MKSHLVRLGWALLGIAVFMTVAITLQESLGIPFRLTLRMTLAGFFLSFIVQIVLGCPGEIWPKVALLLASLFNIGLLVSPLSQLPISKGDFLFFSVPAATICLAVRLVFYRVASDHQREVRRQMVVLLLLGLAFCALIFGIALL